MSKECLNPRIAIQDEPGKQPKFLKHRDLEYYVKLNDKVLNDNLLLLPCGKCPNCLENKAQAWTDRLIKEAEMWKYCYFLTLTYDDEHVKDLNKRDVQLWLKRFRKAHPGKVAYFVNGEYGETTFRPHYHAILFCDERIKDLVNFNNNLFVSEELNKTWSKGQVMVSQDVNERSIKYTIGYTLKKLGETKISLMSKGLGLRYLTENKEKIKRYNGFYTRNGRFASIPFYLMRKIKESEDIVDAEWLFLQSLEPVSSVQLSGSTIDDRLHELLNHKQTTKGKGVF